MNNQLNVFLKVLHHTFQIYMHLCRKKKAARNSDGRIYTSHLCIIYLLLARYLGA